MLIDESRPKLYVKDIECQNISIDNKVFFIEEGHKYYHEDDIVDGNILPFEQSKYQFSSPTGIIGKLKVKFNTKKIASKYVIDHGLDITWEELAAQWQAKADAASEDGTLLHGYSEALWNGWDMDRPDHVKSEYVEEMYESLSKTAELAKTELLVYSLVLKIAGQVDLLLRNADKSKYYLYDYKFLKKSLEKKSYYNHRTKKYKYMKGPFRKLHDCNYFHYSIQMEIYRYLMGALGRKVVRKALIVVTPDKYEIVDGFPIKIWVSKTGILHAKYKDYKGEEYDSSRDRVYMKAPFRILKL